MNHTYKIFEVDANGQLHDTGKVVSVPALNFGRDTYGYVKCDELSIVMPVFEKYGYDRSYSGYYHIPTESTKDRIVINYQYHEGLKTTWVLKRGR